MFCDLLVWCLSRTPDVAYVVRHLVCLLTGQRSDHAVTTPEVLAHHKMHIFVH